MELKANAPTDIKEEDTHIIEDNVAYDLLTTRKIMIRKSVDNKFVFRISFNSSKFTNVIIETIFSEDKDLDDPCFKYDIADDDRFIINICNIDKFPNVCVITRKTKFMETNRNEYFIQCNINNICNAENVEITYYIYRSKKNK